MRARGAVRLRDQHYVRSLQELGGEGLLPQRASPVGSEESLRIPSDHPVAARELANTRRIVTAVRGIQLARKKCSM